MNYIKFGISFKLIPFEFYEFNNLISQGSLSIIAKLWLIGNKEIQKDLRNYVNTIIIPQLQISVSESIIKKRIKFLFLLFTKIENFQIKSKNNSKKLIEYFLSILPHSIKILDIYSFSDKLIDSKIEYLPKNLTALRIDASELTDSMISYLPTKLNYFEIMHARKITNMIFSKLPSHLEHLIIFNSSKSQIYDFDLINFGNLKTLYVIKLFQIM